MLRESARTSRSSPLGRSVGDNRWSVDAWPAEGARISGLQSFAEGCACSQESDDLSPRSPCSGNEYQRMTVHYVPSTGAGVQRAALYGLPNGHTMPWLSTLFNLGYSLALGLEAWPSARVRKINARAGPSCIPLHFGQGETPSATSLKPPFETCTPGLHLRAL